MRSTSTVRPSAISTTARSVPDTTSARAGKVAHSACQPPTARSCSWNCALRIVAARLGAIIAADNAVAAPAGLRFCGSVEETATARPRGLERLADFGLHQQRHVACDLAAGAGEDRERGCDLGKTVPVRVPRCVGHSEIKLRGKPLGDVEALFLERGQRAGGAAELQDQNFLAQPPQPVARARQRRGITRELEPERHRQRLLEQGARHGHVAAMAPGECRERLGGAIEILEQRVEHGAELEHHGCVDHVLAGRAPMNVPGRLLAALADFGGQRVDQGGGEIAGDDRALAQRRKIVVPDLTGFSDGAGMARGHDADRGLGARERGLEIEHALHARTVVEHGAHLVGRVERRQKRRREQRVGHSRANVYSPGRPAPTPNCTPNGRRFGRPLRNKQKRLLCR